MSESTATDGLLLCLRGIHKRFPGVHALRGVDLDVDHGEVHAVVGENGAGKTTLMQILAGVFPPDAGRIDFEGRHDVVLPDERAAQALGIALVYQERSLFGPMNVAENVFAARQPVTRCGRIDGVELGARTKALLEDVGLAVAVDVPLERLSPAQQQLVEVAKALSLGPKLLMFDEPTAALTPVETERLFRLIRRLRERDAANRPGLRPRLRDINFSIRAGEIVGLAGLVGAGRTELALALFGAREGMSGEIRVEGRNVVIGSPAAAIAAGIGYLPEERKVDGLFLEISIEDNIASVASTQFGSWWYSGRRQRAAAEEMCRTLHVVCRGTCEPVKNLSGGNQQKVVLARWLLARPKVLIVDEPTRGVDIGAKAEIHNLLYDLARMGTAILVISSDLHEVLAVSDRVLIMREGRITGELTHAEATEAAVMKYASLG